jgi:surface antigen
MTKNRIRMGLRFAVPALLALSLMGCASSSFDDAADDAPPPAHLASALPAEHGSNHVESRAGQQALQCVPYAREHSGIKITGDAYTWWDQAVGRYERGSNPAAGTVMVLFNYAGPQRGHVAVVRRVVSAREIRIDHANWLDDGSIYVNDPVVDVSAAHDWSQIKVWNIKTGGWGTKIFPVQGFIGPGSSERNQANAPTDSPTDNNDDDAPADALTAVNDAAPAERIAVVTPSRTKAATRTAAPSPDIGAAMTPDERDPSAESGFALTAQDRALP